MINELFSRRVIDYDLRSELHAIRIAGNAVVHSGMLHSNGAEGTTIRETPGTTAAGDRQSAVEEQSSSQSTLWIRDNPPRPLDFPALAALGDSFFPRLFTRTQRFFPAGTVSLTLHFHADSLELASVGREYVLGSARANRAYRSYHDQSAYLWSSAGRLLLSSTQMMYYKA